MIVAAFVDPSCDSGLRLTAAPGSNGLSRLPEAEVRIAHTLAKGYVAK